MDCLGVDLADSQTETRETKLSFQTKLKASLTLKCYVAFLCCVGVVVHYECCCSLHCWCLVFVYPLHIVDDKYHYEPPYPTLTIHEAEVRPSLKHVQVDGSVHGEDLVQIGGHGRSPPCLVCLAPVVQPAGVEFRVYQRSFLLELSHHRKGLLGINAWSTRSNYCQYTGDGSNEPEGRFSSMGIITLNFLVMQFSSDPLRY